MGVDHPTRPEAFTKLEILGVVGILRLFFGVQVVEVAKELIESVVRRQELILVAQVVLPELAGGIAQVLHELRDAGVLLAEADIGAGQAHLSQTGADRRLSRDERGPAGSTALLTIPAGEHCAFLGDPVDVRRPVSHVSPVVNARIEPTDIIAHDDENVGFLLLRLRFGESERGKRKRQSDGATGQRPVT